MPDRASPVDDLVPRGRLSAARVRTAAAAARGERTRGSVVWDVLVCVAMLLAVPITWWTQGSMWAALPTWWPPLDLAMGALMVPVMWWRRRYPVAVALVAGVVGGIFLSAGAAAVVSAYTVASMRRLWIAVVTTVIHLSFGFVYFDLVRIEEATPTEMTTVLVLLYVATLAIGLAVRARRQVIAGIVAASDTERREAAERLVRAEDDERARIAREMHDVLAHRLSILSVHAGALEHRARADAGTPLEPEELRQAAAVIRTASHAALEELRDVLGVLRAGDGADGELGTARPQPTAADLDGLLAEAGAAGQRVALEAPERGRLAGARPQLQRTVYRVVQEGLTNARKHAPGARVEIALTPDDDGIDVRVRNAVAVGITPTEMPGAGAGLGGLATRVRLDGGTLAGAVTDGAFELHARIPWRP